MMTAPGTAMYDQKKIEAALLKLMREHGGTVTVDPATQPDQAVALERLAAAGTVVLVSRSAAGMSTYQLHEQQLQFHRGQAVTWEPGGQPIHATVVRTTPKFVEIMFRNVTGGAELRRVLPAKLRPQKR
jgi:hypothetical protein